MEGWIKIHRGILDWEWYSDTNCVRLALHLLLKANFQQRRWQGMVIERGQLVTSRSVMSRETGLSEREIRTAISKLGKSEFLTSETTSRHTIVTICNYERYQSYEYIERPAERPACDQASTKHRPSIDHNVRKKEVEENSTHTVDTSEGVVGGDAAEAAVVNSVDAEVSRMLDWVSQRFPQIAAMDEPFVPKQMRWLLARYDREDIRRIVAAMDNKQAWRNRSAFCTFTSYAGRDHEIAARRQAEREGGRLYTYLQMVMQLPCNGGSCTPEDFEQITTPQGLRWRRKNAMAI